MTEQVSRACSNWTTLLPVSGKAQAADSYRLCRRGLPARGLGPLRPATGSVFPHCGVESRNGVVRCHLPQRSSGNVEAEPRVCPRVAPCHSNQCSLSGPRMSHQRVAARYSEESALSEKTGAHLRVAPCHSPQRSFADRKAGPRVCPRVAGCHPDYCSLSCPPTVLQRVAGRYSEESVLSPGQRRTAEWHGAPQG
jgi:hypothetical protein